MTFDTEWNIKRIIHKQFLKHIAGCVATNVRSEVNYSIVGQRWSFIVSRENGFVV